MNEGAIEAIQATAVKAASVTVFHLPGDPAHRSHIYNHQDGSLHVEVAEPPLRQYELFTLDGLVEGLKHFLTGVGDYTDALVLCGRGAVTAILDEKTYRRENLLLLFPFSGPFNTLWELEEHRTVYPHGGFIDLLRIDLAPGVREDVLLAVRNLHIKAASDSKSQVDQGKETLGREVIREAQMGAHPVPDLIDVCVYVYRDLVMPGVLQRVSCALKVDLEAGTLALIPLAGQVERAQQQTDTFVAQYIQKAVAASSLKGQITVLCGGRGASDPSD